MASTRGRHGRRIIVLGAVVAGAAVLIPTAAQAVPKPADPVSPSTSTSSTTAAEPTTIAGVEAKLTSLSHTNEVLTEKYNAAQISVKKAKKSAAAASKAATAAVAAQKTAQRNLAVSLSQQYRSASFSHTAALLTSGSGQSYIQASQSLSLIADHQGDVVDLAHSTRLKAQAASVAAKKAVSSAVAEEAAVTRQRTSLSGQVDKYKSLLATLTAAQKATFLSTDTAKPAQVAAVFAKPVKASKGAAAAIAAARAELGKPYVFAAAGPGAFDCSGLTMWAWAAAGVSLPHDAAAQYNYGTHVSLSALEPGDLVFFYSPISHVGIYIGGGLMIHAPTTGDVVKISPINEMGAIAGATRLG